ncbi:MAG: exodeoxyribonuclease VII small subunit [Planctomycetaceae bacterium]
MAKRKPSESESGVSFEQSLSELQSIVADLEDGSLGLESSLERFEKGIGLLRTCYSILESAEAKVEILTRFNGEAAPDTAPFDTTATFKPGIESPSSRGIADADEGETDGSKASLF